MKRSTGYLVGLGLFAVLIYLGKGSISTSITIFKPNLFFLSLYCLFTLLLFLISALRWGYITTELAGMRVCSHFDYFFYHILGRFSSQYIPQIVGDLFVRPGALKRLEGAALDKAVSATFIDKFFDLIVISAFIGPSILYFFDIVAVRNAVSVILISTISLFLLVVLKGSSVVSFVETAIMKVKRLFSRFLFTKKLIKQKHSEKIQKLEYAKGLRRQSLILIMVLTVIRYLILVLSVYFLSESFGLNIPIIVFFMGTPIAQLSMLFAFTPGALGFLEGGWYTVLALSGVIGKDITVFLIGQRAYFFIFICGIFVISYLIFGIKRLVVSRNTIASVKDVDE